MAIKSEAQKQHAQSSRDFILLLGKATNARTQFAFGYSSHKLSGHDERLTLNVKDRIQPLSWIYQSRARTVLCQCTRY